ncbi:MAG: hypothetical protein JST54_03550 [Deltaproteobacteria bacterium]|nr:hypothetical protein [Deltaproteobacteria bacterium]
MLLALLLAASPVTIDAGPLKVRVVIAETPNLFHAVDQLSGWFPYAHKQYRRYYAAPEHGGLSPEDEQLLAAHAAVRKAHGWGMVDAALLSGDSLDDALAGAVRQKALTADEAATERKVLAHFQPRLHALFEAQRPALERFAQGALAATPELTAYAKKASRFWGGSKVDTQLVLVATPPGGGGGGYAGGRLVVEVDATSSPTYVLEHEGWHAFAEPHDAALHAAATELGTDYETVSEGLAYAVAPGIWKPASDPDQLVHQVAKDAAAHKSFFDEPYVRFNRLGLALRPTLGPALDGNGTFESYLATEKAVYRALAELAAVDDKLPPRYFFFGPRDDALARAISQEKFDIWSRPVQEKFLDELRPKIRPSDRVVLVLDASPLPPAFTSFLGDNAAKLAALRQASKAGEASLAGPKGEQLTVIWAADSAGALEKARTSALLRPESPDAGR